MIAATKNKNIKQLNLGTISSYGLKKVNYYLADTGLVKISFEEDPEKPFDQESKDCFVNVLKYGIEFSEGFSPDEAGSIQKVSAKLITKDKRIDYFCDQRKKLYKQHKKFKNRNKVLAQKNLVKTVIKNIEGKYHNFS
jgi:hypothetical protein